MRIGRASWLAGSVLSCAQAWAAGESIQADSFEGGLECTTVAPTTLVVDARSALVQPTFLLNGAPFSASALQSGEFFLIPDEGEPVLLGTTFAPPPGGVRVLKGVYDVQYQWRAGDQVPRNVAARVLQGVLIDGNGALVVDVPSTTLRGALTMNAAPFPQTVVGTATLSLEGIHELGRVVLGSSNDGTYNVRLIPGAYNLRYQSPGASGAIPRNQDALRERHDIEPDTDVLNFDIPAVLADFQFQIDGDPAPVSDTEKGVLSLRTKTGDRVDLGESNAQSLLRRLIPGIYDAYWEGLTGASVAPANEDSRFERDLAIGAGIVVLDVPTVAIAGDFTINGAVPPVSGTENGRVWLRDQLTGSETQLGETNPGTYARLVIPDTYDLVYTESTGASVVPQNERVIFERDRSFKSGAQDIDIPAAFLSWQLTLNGSPFPESNTENASIRLRSGKDLEDTYVGETQPLGANPGERVLVPGSYVPTYTRILGSVIPVNTRATLADDYVVAPNEPGTQTIEVSVGSFAFSFRNNGVVFANDPVRVASFELRHREDVVDIGATNQGVGFRPLIANVRPLPDGRSATAYYTWEAGGLTEMPQNVDQPVACFAFVTP